MDHTRTLSSYGHLPMLGWDNYQLWQIAIKAFLTPYEHVHVLTCVQDVSGGWVDPAPPTDTAGVLAWRQSKGIAMGVVASTIYQMHSDLIAHHKGGSVLTLWKDIEKLHIQRDVSIRHEAWTSLLGHCKRADEDYVDYWHRGVNIKSHIS